MSSTNSRTVDELADLDDARIRKVYGIAGEWLEDRSEWGKAREVLLAVEPDEGEDNCLAEALARITSWYGEYLNVSSITCEGWEGGFDGPRDFVLILIRLRPEDSEPALRTYVVRRTLQYSMTVEAESKEAAVRIAEPYLDTPYVREEWELDFEDLEAEIEG